MGPCSSFHPCARATNPSVSSFLSVFPSQECRLCAEFFFGSRFLQSGSAVPRDQRLSTAFSFLFADIDLGACFVVEIPFS
jgi:hypothetical protein